VHREMRFLLVAAACMALLGVITDRAGAAVSVSLDESNTLKVLSSGDRPTVVAIRSSLFGVVTLSNGSQPSPGRGCTATGARETLCSGTVQRVLYVGGEGDDIVDVSNLSVPAVISGGGGNDAVFGSHGPNTMAGGPGADTLYGGATTDRLDGEAGDDLLRIGPGRDTAVAGAGDDILVYDTQVEAVLIGGSGENFEVPTNSTTLAPVEADEAAAADFGPSNATPVVKGAAGKIEVRVRARRRPGGHHGPHKIRICMHTETKSSHRLPLYPARVWPARRDFVTNPRSHYSAWYAHASVGRCGR
jgi:RTX calcium-binding nonapeptide repeat (4 copies)